MRLFLSYVREEQDYCTQIAQALHIHEVWYDSRLTAGQDWKREIYQRLEWCEGFVYLLSPKSVQSPNCIEEMELALRMDKIIFPVIIRPNTEIPEAIRHIQYSDLSAGMTLNSGSELLNAIYTAEIARLTKLSTQSAPVSRRVRPGSAASSASESAPVLTAPMQPERVRPAVNGTARVVAGPVSEIMSQIAVAMEAAQYEEAYDLINRAIDMGVVTKYIDLFELRDEAEVGARESIRRRQIEHDYYGISQLVQRTRTRAFGCRMFQNFREDHPDYDPDGLASICQLGEMSATFVSPESRTFSLPMLEWCRVPEGELSVVVERGMHRSRESLAVPAFAISKYPVTNAQYDVFVNESDGYENALWWEFSPEAIRWRAEHPQAQPGKFAGDDRPRESVTWYEGVAFSRWLSYRTGLDIHLPLRQQWMRAARGDDDRIYPWGSEFQTSLCNTSESKLHQTSLVMRFVKGVSPFGVFDMAGNVWQWCLNNHFDDEDITSDRPRAVHGGSYMSTHQKAQIGSFMLLAPATCFNNIGFRLVCRNLP
jgi:formylglycine-generating enzyme required for sulfatase activity